MTGRFLILIYSILIVLVAFGTSLAQDVSPVQDSSAVISCNSTSYSQGEPIGFTQLRDDIQIKQFVVYDRWGEVMHEAEKIPLRWDPQCKGRTFPIGTYIYLLEYWDADMASTVRKVNTRSLVAFV